MGKNRKSSRLPFENEKFINLELLSAKQPHENTFS